ncbi:MAG: GNAT family N-acetyltransferase [Burkholderiales bacterium]
MFLVKPYVGTDAPAWDALVDRSRNGNFLHRRSYMDYHADRFEDCSLVVVRDGELVAVFPAEVRNERVTSHGGLSYAGLISSSALRAEAALAVFERIGEHYRSRGIKNIVYKAVPHVFHNYPSEEDLYALHRLGARLTRRDISSVIALQQPFRFTSERRRSVRKARRAGIRLQTGGDSAEFHRLLSGALHRHHATPTHSLEELRLLQGRFPHSIMLHEARRENALLAGVVIYDFGDVVHAQYMAASDQGRQEDALTFLLAELVENIYPQRCYFSFGISTEQQGQVLNGGLVEQKERFGARAIAHDCYEWAL